MDETRRQAFASKYQGADQIWSGKSFLNFIELKELLAELPISQVAAPVNDYPCRDQGNLDFVFGELLYNLSGYEGLLADKVCHLDACRVKAVQGANTVPLVFELEYTTKKGEKGTRTFEVVRMGERDYIMFSDKYRTQ